MCRRSPLVTATANRTSNANPPSPTQMGRYGERNGITASAKPMGTYPSATVVATWMTTRARQKSERLRCTAWDKNLGHRSVVHPTEETMPSTTVEERTMSATSPVARVRYHSDVAPCPTVAISGALIAPKHVVSDPGGPQLAIPPCNERRCRRR